MILALAAVFLVVALSGARSISGSKGDAKRCLYFFNGSPRYCPPQTHKSPSASGNTAMQWLPSSVVSIDAKLPTKPSVDAVATRKPAGTSGPKAHKSDKERLATTKPITSQTHNCNPAQPALIYGTPYLQTPKEGTVWLGRPDCFAKRTCVQASCTLPERVGKSTAYTERCPNSTMLMGVFIAASNVSNITFCDGKLQTAFAEVSKSDIAYLTEKCQASRGKTSYATAAYWNAAQKVSGVSRRIQLLLRIRGQDLFYYRAIGVTDGNGTSGNYVYLTNNAASKDGVTYKQLDASVRQSTLCKAPDKRHG